MRLAIVTDAWRPQVNGVVKTLGTTADVLRDNGHDVSVFSPEGHRTLPCPSYPEIRLAIFPGRRLGQQLQAFDPEALHIATEGPLGIAARRYCINNGLAFTTSYHTQFPEYVRKRAPIPEAWSYAHLRRHHAAAARTMVATLSMRDVLVAQRFENVVIWPRGVDTQQFSPTLRKPLEGEGPILLYAGRVAVEKNLEAFLELDASGTKYVVGDGPDLPTLRSHFPDARFVGYKFGEELARYFASADVFVFPSRTDTFGLVMLEAMATGTPVAAYPVTGPIDVVDDGVTGFLDEDLERAITNALGLDRAGCRAAALERTWEKATARFASHLVQARTGAGFASLSTVRSG